MFHMFDTDTKEKVLVRTKEGTAIVNVGETATIKVDMGAIGETVDLRDYIVLAVMSGHGDDIGDTNYSGNPTTACKVVNGEVYPSAIFNFVDADSGMIRYDQLKIKLYNDASDSSKQMWYRIVLLKVR